MASSGSDKPRVPPPPLLRKPSAPSVVAPPSVAKKDEPEQPDVDDASTAEHPAPTPSAIEASAPTFVPPSATDPIPPVRDGDAEDVDLSARELDVLFDSEPDDAANEPAPKPKHALPRPKPVKSKASEFAAPPSRTDAGTPSRRSTPPPLSGNVPKGVKPPQADGAKRPEDTDVLIAALGAELIDDDEPAAGESAQGPAAPAAITSSVPGVAAASSSSFSAEGAGLDDDLEAQPRKPPLLWIAVGALAAIVVAAVALSWGDEAAEPAAVSRAASDGAYSASMSANNEKDGGQAKPVIAARREAPAAEEANKEGEPEAAAELAAAEVEEVAVADADAEEVAVANADIADVEQADEEEVAEVGGELAAPVPTPSEPTATASSRPGTHGKRNKQRGKQPEHTVAASHPPPAASSSSAAKAPPKGSKGEPTADELLASAKKALASGNNSAAYSLAAQSRRLKRTNDALQVMAKAGCRMGSENKAKAAFSQLPLGLKSGIRSECRAKGIRLGL